MMKMAGMKVPVDILYQAVMIDRLSLLVWLQTPDGAKGIHRPDSIAKRLLETETSGGEIDTVSDPEEFEDEWKRRTGVK